MNFIHHPREVQLHIYESLRNMKDEDFEPFFELFMTPEQKARFIETRKNELFAMIFEDIEAPTIVTDENGLQYFDRSNGRRIYSSCRAYHIPTYSLERLERDHHLRKVIVAPLSLWISEDASSIENFVDYKDPLCHEFYFENTGKHLPVAKKPEHLAETLAYMKSVIDGNL